MPSFNEPARNTPIFGEFEILVLGGGPAGIAAARCFGNPGAQDLIDGEMIVRDDRGRSSHWSLEI